MTDNTPLTPPDPETIAAAMAAAQVAHDLTRGHDALYMAGRRASLADLVSAAEASGPEARALADANAEFVESRLR